MNEKIHKISGQVPSCALWLKNGDGKIFFQQRDSMPQKSPLQYGLWGGAIDPGETPEQAASRELFEELGVQTAIHPLGRRHEMLIENHEQGLFTSYLFEVPGIFTWRNVDIKEGAGGAFFTLEEAFDVRNMGHMGGLWTNYMRYSGYA